MTKTPPAAAAPFQFRLDDASGVPVYRQLIDQVTAGIAAGALAKGTQLPTVRQVAVDLAINPNTVLRAYRELEIRGVLDTQQGTGTFVANKPAANTGDFERQRRLDQLIADLMARAGAGGFAAKEVAEALREQIAEPEKRKR